MQKIEPKKVITLGNGEKYLVVAHTTKDDKDYYYIAETNLEETEIKENYKIVCASYEYDNIYLYEVI